MRSTLSGWEVDLTRWLSLQVRILLGDALSQFRFDHATL